MTTLTTQLDRGWELRSRGSWAGAIRIYEALLADARTYAAEAVAAEGSGQSAWWSGNVDAMVRRYMLAYQSYRLAGDVTGAARVATWLGHAASESFAKPAVANSWFARAEKLLPLVGADREKILLELFRGLAAAAADNPWEAAKRAEQVVRLSSELRHAGLTMEGQALLGASHVQVGQVESGIQLLETAMSSVLAESPDDVTTLWLPSSRLMEICAQTRDWQRAQRWWPRIMRHRDKLNDQLNADPLLADSHIQYASLLTWRGEWRLATRQLSHIVAQPDDDGAPQIGRRAARVLADIWLRLGRIDDAYDLATRNQTTPDYVVAANVDLIRKDPRRAMTMLRDKLIPARSVNSLTRIPALESMIRASTATHQRGVQDFAITELIAAARRAGTAGLAGSAMWARGMRCRSQGDAHGAAVLFRAALVRFEHAGGTHDAGRTRLDLAEALLTAVGPQAAIRQAQLAYDSFKKLGASLDRQRAVDFIRRARQEALPRLTHRQIGVLRLLAEGLTIQDVASKLTLSERTIKRHLQEAQLRTDAPNRKAVLEYARTHGLL